MRGGGGAAGLEPPLVSRLQEGDHHRSNAAADQVVEGVGHQALLQPVRAVVDDEERIAPIRVAVAVRQIDRHQPLESENLALEADLLEGALRSILALGHVLRGLVSRQVELGHLASALARRYAAWIARIGNALAVVANVPVFPAAAGLEGVAAVKEVRAGDARHGLRAARGGHRALDRDIFGFAVVDEVDALALDDRQALLRFQVALDRRGLVRRRVERFEEATELPADLGRPRLAGRRRAAAEGDRGHLLEIPHQDAPVGVARPGVAADVESLDPGPLDVALGAGVGQHDVAGGGEERELVAHQDQPAPARRPRAPESLAGLGVDAGEDLAAVPVEVAVVVDRQRVGPAELAGPVELAHAEPVVAALEGEHHALARDLHQEAVLAGESDRAADLLAFLGLVAPELGAVLRVDADHGPARAHEDLGGLARARDHRNLILVLVRSGGPERLSRLRVERRHRAALDTGQDHQLAVDEQGRRAEAEIGLRRAEVAVHPPRPAKLSILQVESHQLALGSESVDRSGADHRARDRSVGRAVAATIHAVEPMAPELRAVDEIERRYPVGITFGEHRHRPPRRDRDTRVARAERDPPADLEPRSLGAGDHLRGGPAVELRSAQVRPVGRGKRGGAEDERQECGCQASRRHRSLLVLRYPGRCASLAAVGARVEG